jgi:hypothetical protein
MSYEKKLLCQKYSEEIDTEKNPCPHPDDYCRHRTGCVINTQCMDNVACKEKRRKILENTR